jgi:quercetin dioxygenase-like cupin family protein
MPAIIDLNAEAVKLAAVLKQTPMTSEGRKSASTKLGPYRDGILFLGTSVGTGAGHWEIHPEDELVHVLDGTRTLDIVCDEGPPRSYELRAGTVAVVPRGAWHRFHRGDVAMVMSAVIPGEHVDGDFDDPRKGAADLAVDPALGRPNIIDLDAEVAKLATFRGMTPQTTSADRKGSAANLGPYRNGILFLSKWSGGKTHWETHPEDELVHILDGSVTLDIIEADRPRSHVLSRGKMVVVPNGAWHRFRSADGLTAMSATVPGSHIELDVDDPRQVERGQQEPDLGSDQSPNASHQPTSRVARPMCPPRGARTTVPDPQAERPFVGPVKRRSPDRGNGATCAGRERALNWPAVKATRLT